MDLGRQAAFLAAFFGVEHGVGQLLGGEVVGQRHAEHSAGEEPASQKTQPDGGRLPRRLTQASEQQCAAGSEREPHRGTAGSAVPSAP